MIRRQSTAAYDGSASRGHPAGRSCASHCVGLVLGGAAGARLGATLDQGAGRTTLLQLICTTPRVDSPTPRVLSIDDFVRPVPSKQAIAWGWGAGAAARPATPDNLTADDGCNPYPCVNQEMPPPSGSDWPSIRKAGRCANRGRTHHPL